MPHPVPVVSGRHRPHEVLLLAVSLITGVAYTIGAPAPASVAALLPDWALHVWAGGLLLSGVLGLIGVAFVAPWALQIEQAAMLLGAGALCWYAAGVAPFGWRALLGGCISIAWAAANLWRAWQIRQDLKGGP